MMLAQVDIATDPWKFVPHPEVWLLTSFLTIAYIYTVRVIGPKAVAPAGHEVRLKVFTTMKTFCCRSTATCELSNIGMN